MAINDLPSILPVSTFLASPFRARAFKLIRAARRRREPAERPLLGDSLLASALK